jgi:[ribosomal protein S5]-alanine N-acetyltransferase
MEKDSIPQTNAQPTLSTDRLILRPFRLSDCKEVQRIAGDERIAKTTLSVPHPYPDGAAEEWIATHPKSYAHGEAVTFAIELKTSNALIGCISIAGISKTHKRGEVGYWIGTEFWNQGYCTEALRALIEFGFKELSLNKLTSRHMSKNPQSGKVMLKAGMKQEGVLRDDCFRYEQFEDSVVYGLVARDYFKSA